MKTIRLTSYYQIRTFCMDYDFYTRGNCAEYENLLYKITPTGRNLTDNRLAKIVIDIYDHSSTQALNNANVFCYEDMANKLLNSKYISTMVE